MGILIPYGSQYDKQEYIRVEDGLPFIEIAYINGDGEVGEELLLTDEEAKQIGDALIRIANVRSSNARLED